MNRANECYRKNQIEDEEQILDEAHAASLHFRGTESVAGTRVTSLKCQLKLKGNVRPWSWDLLSDNPHWRFTHTHIHTRFVAIEAFNFN